MMLCLVHTLYSSDHTLSKCFFCDLNVCVGGARTGDHLIQILSAAKKAARNKAAHFKV